MLPDTICSYEAMVVQLGYLEELYLYMCGKSLWSQSGQGQVLCVFIGVWLVLIGLCDL